MRKLISALFITSLLLAAFPAAPTAQAEAYRYTTRHSDGWPKWIGRHNILYYTYRQKPEMAAKYLPLGLIKTGGFQKLVGEVADTPSVDTTDWPSWIGEIAQ